MTSRRTKMGLVRIAAAALLTVAIAAVGPSAVAQSANRSANPAPAETTLIKFSDNGTPQKLSLPVNKGAVVEFDRDVRDVFAASPGVVDAVVRTPRRIFIMAQKIGTTNLILIDANGGRIGTLEITVGADVATLNDQIARQMPGSRVKAEAVNDGIVLGGTVTSAAQASQAQAMASRVAGSADRVVNGLKIEQATQVLIQVRVAEMSRTIAKQFGVNITGAIGKTSNGVPIFASTDNQFSLLGRALASMSGARVGSVGVECIAFNLVTNCNPTPTNVQGVVRALEEIGLVHTLAEPNLTAVSG